MELKTAAYYKKRTRQTVTAAAIVGSLAFALYNYNYIPSAVLLTLLGVFIIMRIIDYSRMSRALQILSAFEHDEYTGSFKITSAQYNYAQNSNRAVLFIHGFSASVNEFKNFTGKLKQEKVSYSVPMLTGFGLDDLHLLRSVKWQDWLRDAVAEYDRLKQENEFIDVVGHSMGALISLILSQIREVNNLVITAPYIKEKPGHSFRKKLIVNDFTGPIISYIYRYTAKSKRAVKQYHSKYPERFAYDILPSNAVRQLWLMQAEMNLEKSQYSNLYLLTGGEDNTVVNEAVLELLKKSNLKYEHLHYPESGHNIFEDRESEKAVKNVMQIILGKK